MKLGELIRILEKQPLSKKVKFGFGKAASYRGYYEQVAFQPKRDVDVHFMLMHAKIALGNTFNGYKGGRFTMTEDTIVNIANSGHCSLDGSDELTKEKLQEMLNYQQD